MKFFKKIIALFCIIAISFSLFSVPVFAVGAGEIGDFASGLADFGQWAIDSSLYGIKLVARIFDDDVCPERPGGVNTTHSFVVNKTSKDGVLADWYVCEYCGFNSGYKADSESLSVAYNDYVQTLPASGFNSAGRLIYRPTRCILSVRGSSGSYTQISPQTNKFFSVGNSCFIYNYTYSSPQNRDYTFEFKIDFAVPYSGYYKLLPELAYSYSVGSVSGTEYCSEGSFKHYSSPPVSSSDTNDFQAILPSVTVKPGTWTSCHIDIYFPTVEVIPDSGSGSGSIGDVYNISTRPTSITGGNYGIVGDNGQITKVENNSTIVNETNNTYYNPATGQTQPITNWTYDYSDRSYTLTLDGGKTSTVTYGDEYITIEEGDTVYNIYYVVDGSGTENPPAACTHDWQETSTTPATCTASGSKVLTCSKCQQTKTEALPALGHNWQETKSTPATCTVPGSKVRTCSRCQQTETETLSALGHDWQVKQTVTTQYDDSGQLTQQGYTIFECSRCHEQYKSTDGVAPPGGSGTDPGGEGDTTIGGLIEKLLSGLGGVLSGIIKGLLALLTQAVEAISGIGELFTSFVGSLVGLWGGFTDFLAAVFPFLPAEFITIVELGLILMIAVAVFKKFVS